MVTLFAIGDSMRKRLSHILLRRAPARHRGSALLIVLGFLSFMVISAVSFAIYMRTERQASSNYRHAVNARHMLNIALARAMEEVDSELRLKSNDDNLKFPDWPGRVLASALPIEGTVNQKDVQGGSDVRVLSMEALSFLPPVLVNDVRRYACWQPQDGSQHRYRGAKWRPFSSSVVGGTSASSSADDAPVNGRYAYVCVNVSDMFDVNICRARYRDCSTNRVSLGHLFENDAERRAFDDNAAADGHYFSLQDFYSARYERSKSNLSSPFHNYVAPGGSLQPFEEQELLKQVFITDGIARSEPTNKVACNIWLNPPISGALLNNRTPVSTDLKVNDKFWEAFTHSGDGKKLFPEANSSAHRAIMAALLKDYIDADNVPSLLNAPCLEMVPMISQITIPHDAMKYSVEVKAGAKPEDPQVTTLHLLADKLAFPIQVEVVWPFKHAEYRPPQPAYTLEIEAFFVVSKDGNERSTTGFNAKQEWIPLAMAEPVTIPPFWRQRTIKNENDCFEKVDVVLEADKNAVTFDVIRGGAFQNGFTASFRVSLCMFARVKEGDTWVDSVPHEIPVNPLDNEAKRSNPKLYYQTQAITLAEQTVVPTPYAWDWTSLEVADPRFNHKASNWVKSNETYPITPGVNQSTKAILSQPDGRDADIFMFVANTGVLQSPGELGFIIRPHNFRPADDPSRRFNDASAAEPYEKEHMFRTIRLYDHGGTGVDELRDEVYRYFYVMRPDGTLPGARVNPLSDIDEVLEAAIWDTPLDYWVASPDNGLTVEDRVTKNLTFTRHPNYFNSTGSPNNSDWKGFLDKWVDGLDDVMDETDNPNSVWSKTLSDFYGDLNYFKWYDEDRKKIFGTTVPNNLHEIDRKMLYSFSLDSFSDRQQLFLYFIRAEVTMPTFGGGAEMQSLAGGRAVALVWRDPYPRGFVKDNNTNNDNDRMDKDEDWYPDNDYMSPWRRYHEGANNKTRYEGYHDTRVLFFKQLGQ